MTQAVKRTVFDDKKVVLSGLGLFISWVIVFFQGIKTALDIWIESDIFNHCLLVIPGAFYLIYLKKNQLDANLVKPNYWLLPILVGCLFVYAVGIAGDVQLFLHLAAFFYLPIAIWMLIGNRLAYRIMFPLCFILFSIPFGEEFVPFLQELTADWSVAMLNWTGIPIYRNGLYIEIPQGRFLVAEACSGISFFIASVVIGSLYAYINMYSWKRKLLFVTIAILFPVIANAVRVYGIILTGYLTDMEHAVGADHLIYGWVFFALVIMCLLGLGELIREKQEPIITPDKAIYPALNSHASVIKFTWINSSVLCLFFVWFLLIKGQLQPNSASPDLNVDLNVLSEPKPNLVWAPQFRQPYYEYSGSLITIPNIDVYMAWYPKGQGELISSLNRFYQEDNWSLDTREPLPLDNLEGVNLTTIVNLDRKRLLTHWYVIDGKLIADNRVAKLTETWNILLGKHTDSAVIALSMPTEPLSYQSDKVEFRQQVNSYIANLSAQFGYE